MSAARVSPASPEVKRGVRLDELPIAEPQLEQPYSVLTHNDGATTSYTKTVAFSAWLPLRVPAGAGR
jgi:hypothetical protein